MKTAKLLAMILMLSMLVSLFAACSGGTGVLAPTDEVIIDDGNDDDDGGNPERERRPVDGFEDDGHGDSLQP